MRAIDVCVPWLVYAACLAFTACVIWRLLIAIGLL